MLYLEIALASLIAGVLDTVVGFGGALLLMPVLVLIVGVENAVLLSALISLGWNGVRLWMLREWVGWRAALLFTVGILPGAYFGARYLEGADPDLLRIGIGALLILFGAYYVARLYIDLPRVKGLKEWAFPIIGAVSGAIGSALGAGNGPLQTWGLDAAGLTAREVAATNGALGLATGLSRLISYAASGLLHAEIWLPAAVGLAAAAAGSAYGVHLSRKTKDTTLELIVGAALVLAGVRMLL